MSTSTNKQESYKKEFPLLVNHPDIIYLDSAASAQKPKHVIEGIKDFLENSYANIHRGSYFFSEKAEDIYYKSKEKYGQTIWFGADEIIYTYSATYWYNLLAQTLRYSWFLQAGDTVLVDIAEHHANLVPWQMLSRRHGIVVERIDLNEEFDFDIDDFQKKYDHNVKVVSISACSNVTGKIYDIEKIANLLRPETLFVIDGSQAIPHVSFANYACNNRIDVIIATGHKIMADTWIGMLAMRKQHIKSLQPARGWWGMIENVTKDGFSVTYWTEKFEPWTPHIVWAASLLYALEYIESIGWYEAIQKHENILINYALDRIEKNKNIILFGPNKKNKEWMSPERAGIFSFRLHSEKNTKKIGEMLAEKNIFVRAWWHCTHPLFQEHWEKWVVRLSTYIYNDISDLEKTFGIIENL